MRVVLADDEPRVRSALRLLLEQEPGFAVVGEAEAAEQLPPMVSLLSPDLILLDWELPGLRAEEMLPALIDLCPGLLVVALSGRPDGRKDALAAGAHAFVSKGDPPETLLAACRALADPSHADCAALPL
ncbi:MAG: response regulator transcription factor [Chloroflexi bacterium]|nr:response regulator transcription factor [Chloroflexota bacterium]